MVSKLYKRNELVFNSQSLLRFIMTSDIRSISNRFLCFLPGCFSSASHLARVVGSMLRIFASFLTFRPRSRQYCPIFSPRVTAISRNRSKPELLVHSGACPLLPELYKKKSRPEYILIGIFYSNYMYPRLLQQHHFLNARKFH